MWIYRIIFLGLVLFIANDRAWHIFQQGRAQGYVEGFTKGLQTQPQVWKSAELYRTIQ